MDWEGFRLRVVAGDPGLVRLWLALRAILTLLLGLLLARWIPGATPGASVAGIYLSVLLGLMVNDPCPVRRRGTLWRCGLASALMFALGGWLAHLSRSIGNLCFVSLGALSLYLARYGFRSGSLGLMAFFAFLVAQAVNPEPRALWPGAVAVLLGNGLAYLVRFWILPDQPQRTLEWTARAFQAQLALVSREPRPAELMRELSRLNELALTLDEQLRILNAPELRRQVLEAELQAGRAADTRLSGQNHPAPESAPKPWRTPEVPPAAVLPVLTYRGAGPPERMMVLALQAALALFLALGLGQWLAPQHWVWCAAASYMVFLQVRTLGDNLGRAFGRLAGTGLGLAAGLGMSYLLPQHNALRLISILLAFFGGYYMSRVSIFWMILYNTIALSLLWGLLGNPLPQLLEVRMLTTLLGTLLGSLVALLLWPARAARLARLQAGQLLKQIEEVEHLQQDPVAEVRAVDHLIFGLRRLGSSGSLTPLRLPETARLVQATSRLAFASRHFLVSREDYWRGRLEEARQEVRARLAQ